MFWISDTWDLNQKDRVSDECKLENLQHELGQLDTALRISRQALSLLTAIKQPDIYPKYQDLVDEMDELFEEKCKEETDLIKKIQKRMSWTWS
jgi:hypothetical protein